ncbi:hypothetical protein [Amycolatopsis magusensis]|uniref:hypothetical protein n=1 Tax=Amycolatopsis magusensis TaxID=882444 RepID=UPI0037BBB9BA
MTSLLTDSNDADGLVPDEPVTTKEGWRRFVDHQPEPLALAPDGGLDPLTPRGRAQLLQARKDYHSDLPLAATPAPPGPGAVAGRRVCGSGRAG